MKDDFEKGITLRKLVVGYKERGYEKRIAGPLDLVVPPAQMVCLCGPNGGGKSTLLKTMAGFLPPLSGQVIINGIEMQKAHPGEITKLISVVLTHRLEMQATTAYELVAMGRAPHTGFFGRLNKTDVEIIDRSMRLTGTEHLANRLINSLSDGERQKLMIAKALSQDTPVILLDEPTAFLDYPSKVEIMQLLNSLASTRKKIIILSTHDLDIAFSLSPIVWLIDKEIGFSRGTLEALGADDELNRYFTNENLHFDNELKRFTIEQSHLCGCYNDKKH